MKSYYAVIFTSTLSEQSNDYDEIAIKMEQLAKQQPGFLGMETARSVVGITISYWKDIDAIKKWRGHLDHLKAQKLGKEKWYRSYKVRVCRVEREYSFDKNSRNIH